MTLQLDPGDIVVAAIPMRDFVLVFTQGGVVYKVSYREYMSRGPNVIVERL